VSVESGFDGIRRVYERDLGGRVTRVLRAGGARSAYRYDAAARVIGVDHSDGSEEQYAYRPDGALLQAKNQHSTVSFVRDVLGRVVREVQGEHWVLSEYDARGYRVRMTSSLGADQKIVRNALGDVMGLVHKQLGHEQSFETHIRRDLLGLEIERSLPGGLSARWSRDSLGRPVQQRLLRSSLKLRERDYRWDMGDQLRRVLDTQYGTAHYRHDQLGNLASAYFDNGGGRELRLPDAVGNLFRTEDRSDREYGPGGQLLKSTDKQGRVHRYAYDAEGNLVCKTRNDGEQWHYRWGADGMLKSVARPDGSEVTFTYDALGRRLSKTYRGQTTRWVWDGNVPLHEWVEGELQPLVQSSRRPMWMDGLTQQREMLLSAHLTRGPPARGTFQAPITWVFEPESFAPMAKLVGGERLSIVTDHLGVPIAMHDAMGEEVWSAQIGTWGDLRRMTAGDAQDCPFRWPGQYEDIETGLYYNRFRYYDREGGQYVSQDPIGLAGGPAVYGYAKDPATWCDPLGLNACDPSKTYQDKRGRWRDERGRFAKHPGWPANYGFEAGKDSLGTMMPGHRIDRFGHPGGEFVADMGTPFEQRALPATSAAKEYHRYAVVKPIPGVRSGPAAPWFGQLGTGQQHQLPGSVQQLVESGHLVEQ
jgi:RHS repeat-associated protein